MPARDFLAAPYYGGMKLDGKDLGRKDEEDVRKFYRMIPPAGGRNNSIGPEKLRASLGIKKGEFDRRRDILQKHELIGIVQGGGIYRIDRGDDYKKEADYYKPLMRELWLNWAEQRGREYHLRQRFVRVLDTSQGGRAAHGRWTRPDITLLGGKVLPYLPGKFLDVITFEVKLGMPIDGLYEALAHRRRANFAYVVCIWPERDNPPDPKEQATMVAEATRQGVGVILVRQEDDFELWDELVEPVRHEPDPQHLHDFLEDHCKADALTDLRKWLRRPDDCLPPVSDDRTDDPLRRLYLTTKELHVARTMMERIENMKSEKDSLGTSDFRGLGSSDEVLRRVRETLRESNYIETTQGGGVKKLLTLPAWRATQRQSGFRNRYYKERKKREH